jgi:hypothetical protein
MHSRLRIPGAVDPNSSEIPDACVCAALRMLSRYASRRLERLLAGQGLTLTEFQLMLALREGGPARVVGLARRLRLDPTPTGRSLARLLDRGLVSRPERWRFSTWVLERSGAIHLEVMEPFWHDLDQSLRRELGVALVTPLVRAVDRLPAWIPREEDASWLD